MTEQTKTEVKLTKAHERENILFGMGSIVSLAIGVFWLIGVWRYQFARWNAHGRPGWFVPKWPHTITLFVTSAVPGAVIASLDGYGIKHHWTYMQWVLEGGTVGRMVDFWTPDGQWQKADSILYHVEDGYAVFSMPGELREYNFLPYAQRQKHQAQPTKRRAARLGKVYR